MYSSNCKLQIFAFIEHTNYITKYTIFLHDFLPMQYVAFPWHHSQSVSLSCPSWFPLHPHWNALSQHTLCHLSASCVLPVCVILYSPFCVLLFCLPDKEEPLSADNRPSKTLICLAMLQIKYLFPEFLFLLHGNLLLIFIKWSFQHKINYPDHIGLLCADLEISV